MTKQRVVTYQELCASHRRKEAQHPAGKQHCSLVKGQKSSCITDHVCEGLKMGDIHSGVLEICCKMKQVKNSRSVYDGEGTAARTIQTELKQREYNSPVFSIGNNRCA